MPMSKQPPAPFSCSPLSIQTLQYSHPSTPPRLLTFSHVPSCQDKLKLKEGSFFFPAKRTLHVWCGTLWTPEPAQSRRGGGRKLHAQEQRELFRLPTPPPEADSLLQDDLGKSDVCLTERLLQGQHCLRAASRTTALTCSKTALDSRDCIFLLSCNTKSVTPTSLYTTVCNIKRQQVLRILLFFPGLFIKLPHYQEKSNFNSLSQIPTVLTKQLQVFKESKFGANKPLRIN